LMISQDAEFSTSREVKLAFSPKEGKMKTRYVILSASLILLFLMLPGECFSQYDPGIRDTVSIEAPIIHLTGPPYQGTMLLPIYVFNDEVLAQIDIPFMWNGPISCDSGKIVAERIPNPVNEHFSFNNQGPWIVEDVIALGDADPRWIPPGQGEFLNIYFTILDTGFVSIDTFTMWGFLHLMLLDTLAVDMLPYFTPVQIHIQPPLIGDVNHDGQVDAGDVVFLINYLYRESTAPEPIESGDANGDCVVDVGDVVYLINYLYKNGPLPQDRCG
jgi:hypothetical protein